MFKVNTQADYYLYHKASETLIEKLNWTQLHGLCRSLGKELHSSYYLWVSEQDKWIRLEKVVDEILNFNEGLLRYPPHPPDDIGGREYKHQLIEAPENKREYKRHRRKLQMTLDFSGQLMKVESFDISLGGIKFGEKVQLKGQTRFIFLYYSYGNEVLEFKAEPIFIGETSVFEAVRITSCNNLQLWKRAVEWTPNKPNL